MSRNAPLGDDGQPPVAPQASQQLGKLPTHDEPFFGAVQWLVPDFVEHFVLPAAVVRQQVTNPGFPQVEWAAQLTTNPMQLRFVRVAFAFPAAQLTNSPWFLAPVQSHAATAARAAATSVASAPVGSHFAALRCAVNASSENAMAVTKKPRTLGPMIHLRGCCLRIDADVPGVNVQFARLPPEGT